MNAISTPSRAIQWVPSLNSKYTASLESLEAAMTEYYTHKAAYYEDIDFATNNWRDDPVCRWIADEVSRSNHVLEVGCGRASLLNFKPEMGPCYTGSDFSDELLRTNAVRFPAARFSPLGKKGSLPFHDAKFDAVFSIFVLEHCVFPAQSLREWLRVLKPKGRFIVLCPDFLGCGRMSSQRAGYSEGNSRVKLRRRSFVDGLVTLWDNRIRIPRASRRFQQIALREPQFMVNLVPTCFTDTFQPDVDAVYVTFEPELRAHLCDVVDWSEIPDFLSIELQKNRLILLSGVKKS
jgi:SAM-dependent methyltransferase